MRHMFGYVFGAALLLAGLGGCAAESAPLNAEPTERLTRHFDGLTVNGELQADGTIAIVGDDSSGQRVVEIHVKDDLGELEFFEHARRGKTGFALRPGAREQLTLASWVSFANYSMHASDHAEQRQVSSVAPQQKKSCWSLGDVCCDQGDLCLWLQDAWWRL